MKRFIRDCKLLKHRIIELGKIALGGNAGVFIAYLMTLTSPSFLLNPLYFLFILNPIIIATFFVGYFTMWRKEIQTIYDEVEREYKYSFFAKRFGIGE